MSDGKKLEAQGRADEALRAYASQRDWDNALRLAAALNRHLDAARFCLEAQRPYDAAVCFQRGGDLKSCLGALLKVSPDSPRYRAAAVQAVRVAAVVGTPLEKLSAWFMPFIGRAPAAPVEAEAMKSLADVFAATGKLRLALSIYRTVASAFPGDDEAKDRLAALKKLEESGASPPVASSPSTVSSSSLPGVVSQTASPPPSTVSGIMRAVRQRLTDLLVSKGLVPEAQLQKLLRDQPEVGSSDSALAEALVTANLVEPEALLQARSEASGFGWLSDADAVAAVHPDAAKVLSQDQAERFRVAALRVVDRQLHVGMEDPRDFALVDKVRFAAGMKVLPFFVTGGALRRAQSKLYKGEDPGAQEVPSWHGQLYSSDSDLALEPFSDKVTGTREHQFDTGEFDLIERTSEPAQPKRGAPPAAPEPGSAPAVGSKVANRYQLEALLGEGGSASVYRALDLELNEPVALKLFRPMSDREAETLVARFKLELSLSRMLSHPNIIRLFDLGSDAGWRYLTMELLEGKDLASRQQEHGGPLPVTVALVVLEQACTGLQAAHERGVVHRDIKPQNIFVTTTGEVKLMDFGIARRLNTPGVTVMGTIAGTPEYMSPEQINGFSEVTAPTDIYALGVTAYQLLTGAVPFAYAELTRLLIAQASEPPAPLRQKNPLVPEPLEALVLQMLEKDAAKRPAPAGALAAEFRKLREALTS